MNNYDLTKQEIIWLMENCGADITSNMTQNNSNITITGEPDHEVSMARGELDKMAKYSQSLSARMEQIEEQNLPAWVQAKITKASDYVSKVYHYLERYLGDDMEMMQESAEGKINTASHEVEIDVQISKSDMKKLHDGETVVLKDQTGTNSFTINLKG